MDKSVIHLFARRFGKFHDFDLRCTLFIAQHQDSNVKSLVIRQAGIGSHLFRDVESGHLRKTERVGVELGGFFNVADDNTDVNRRSGKFGS